MNPKKITDSLFILLINNFIFNDRKLQDSGFTLRYNRIYIVLLGANNEF